MKEEVCPQSKADFFDAHWMFGRSLKDGFDVVIGNPPYGASLAESTKSLVAQTYKHQPLPSWLTMGGLFYFLAT